VCVRVITRPEDSYGGRSIDSTRKALAAMRAMGVNVTCVGAIHQKFALIDEKTVWYGSINLLSFGSSRESIMRLQSGSIARALSENAGFARRRETSHEAFFN
ncbi:MAG: phospholipase D-like domain-containing protein, partial [Clostridia bacterium]|nr:phospholipase D-like domain-containing protein [Clostridia bacterium]